MLDLNDVPLFASLKADALIQLRRAVKLREYPAGAVVCQRGEQGSAVYAIAAGGVIVQPEGMVGARRQVFLGPGEVFGEMSVLSHHPVSATIVANRDTTTWSISAEDFRSLLAGQPDLRSALTSMLMDRLRHRTSSADAAPGASCLLVAVSDCTPQKLEILEPLWAGVQHYAPGSRRVFVDGALSKEPLLIDVNFEGDTPEVIARVFQEWRHSAGLGQYLVVFTTLRHLWLFRQWIGPDDAVLAIAGPDEVGRVSCDLVDLSAGRHAVVAASARPALPAGESWFFVVPPEELARPSEPTEAWQRHLRPKLDHVVRWALGREIGLALGSGAVKGLAHLGVLDVLEREGIPIDFVSGSSMGGVIALVYASQGSAREGIERARRSIGSYRFLRDVSWWPRSSLLVGLRARRGARELVGAESTFAQAMCPAAVVATDLVCGEPVILDRGLLVDAGLATSAIPGVFPPVASGNRVLVDGALVRRVPVDLLDHRGSGLRIAVNVTGAPSSAQGRASGWGGPRASGSSALGLRRILMRSWELTGLWQATAEAATADVLVEPNTAPYSGHEFDAIDPLIDAGREAASSRLGDIRAAVDSLLRPGVP
jgi:NTE family protein